MSTGKTQFITITQQQLAELEHSSSEIRNVLRERSVNAPLFSQFIGGNTVEMTVNTKKDRFNLIDAEGNKTSVPFKDALGNQIISFLMAVIPFYYPAFIQSDVFARLEETGLKNRLVNKVKIANAKARPSILIGSVKMEDVQVVIDGIAGKRLIDMELGEIHDTVFINEEGQDGAMQMKKRDNVFFAMGKDMNPEHLMSPASFYQKLSGSLAMERYSTAKGKKLQTVEVITEHQQGGIVHVLREPRKFFVADELLTFDGNGLPFGDESQPMLKEIFSSLTVFDEASGEIPLGKKLKRESGRSYKTFMRSMSQSRSSGAVGFENIEDVVTYFLGTGQDEVAYGKKKLDADKKETGFHVMDVHKAYKRFMLLMSNGKSPDSGVLSRFSNPADITISISTKTVGEIEAEIITITNKKGESIRLALMGDFYSMVPKTERFLLNRLNEDYAMETVEEFKHWDLQDTKGLKDILTRNLTDGSGYHAPWITQALREAGVLNSHDAFQLRVSNAVKGAVFEFAPMTDLFDADIILTEGMVKSQDIVRDLRTNGFQMYVVGQRKDSGSGTYVASQAMQNIGLTLPELKKLVDQSLVYAEKAVTEKMDSILMSVLDGTEDETENEFAAMEFIRMSKEFEDVADEQYVKDQSVGMVVKKMNKLLDSKVFIEDAQSNYMFVDPFAIYNAAKDGRYEIVQEDAVLGRNEVIAAYKKDGKAFMRMGKALSIRFPVTTFHEIPVVDAVAKEEFASAIESGLWQGIVFYDAFTWVVATQAGADHDGDSAILIFDGIMVNARIRLEQKIFGGLPVLPFIDAFVRYNEAGVPVEFGAGAPTYVPPAPEGAVTKNVEKSTPDGFVIYGNEIAYRSDAFDGRNADKKREKFLTHVAEMAHDITVRSIETSEVGMIANRAMITLDLLSQTVLTDAERKQVEKDLLMLTTAGRWEIDRPKHGGAFTKMPQMVKLYENYEAVTFTEEELGADLDWKRAELANRRGAYRFIYGETKIEGVVKGFRVMKPNWLASQKDEYGPTYKTSVFQESLAYSRQQLEDFCVRMKENHSNTAENNIRGRVLHNMSLDPQFVEPVKARVSDYYEVYKSCENARLDELNRFKEEVITQLSETGKLRKKMVGSMTKAKKDSRIRKHSEAKMKEFSQLRDLLRAEFRKEMYNLAAQLNLDVRTLVGALYLLINDKKTNNQAAVRADGRELRFVPSNGFIAVPFEVFAEEMQSLISGAVSETYFMPMDLLFTQVQTQKQHVQITTRSLSPMTDLDGKTVAIDRDLRVVVRMEAQGESERKIISFLKKDVELKDYMTATQEDIAFRGFAPEEFREGSYEVSVKHMTVSNEGTVAKITLN